MAYCLNRKELSSLLSCPQAGDEDTAVPEGHLAMASEWLEPLAFLTYSLACVLERNRDVGNEMWSSTLGKAYALTDEMYIKMQEGDVEFTSYMLHHLRSPGLSLEEELVDLERQRLEFRYDKALRY